MLKETFEKRGLMPIWDEKASDWETRRKELVSLLEKEEYGCMPRKHTALTWEEEEAKFTFCAGRVSLKKVTLTVHFGEDKFSFPIYASIPKGKKNLPFFVHINFRDNVPDRYMPVEEICDRGYALISFCYNDVTPDKRAEEIEKDELMDVLFKNTEKQPNHAGKIRIWAWAASRALDYALSLDCLDKTRAAVVGHSRLGKTALVAGMTDERFSFVISNDSGCSGAAITRNKQGETVERITNVFPHWFNENYKKYAGKESEMPFDQHFLIAASAPRLVYAASAENDTWADPESEYLACYAASEVYEKLGIKGFVCENRFAKAPERFHEGNIGYHVRTGDHYFSREDWNNYMDFWEKHR